MTERQGALTQEERIRRGEAGIDSLRSFVRRTFLRHQVVVVILLLLLGAYLYLRVDAFFTPRNLMSIARTLSWIAIAAFGESMVLIIGGIDLSVGAVMALSGLISALAMQVGISVPIAVLLGLSAGALVGWINGTIVARVKLPPFIVTLGTMSIARGITLGISGGWSVTDLPLAFRLLGQHNLSMGAFGVPLPALIMLSVALLITLLMRHTVLGKHIYTLGNSERALLVCGVNVTRLKVTVYTLCGMLASAGGLLMTARLGVAAPTAAVGYELDIVTAAVIGGTSLFGGEGSVPGVLLGALVLNVIRNGLMLSGFSAYWQTAVIGAMILLVILLDYWRRKATL